MALLFSLKYSLCAQKRGASHGGLVVPLSKRSKKGEGEEEEDRHAYQHEGVQVTCNTFFLTEMVRAMKEGVCDSY